MKTRKGLFGWQCSEIIQSVVTQLTDLKIFFIFVVFCGGLIFLTGCNANIRGTQRPLLRHEPIRGELELVAERRSDKQQNGLSRRESKTNVFEERLKLETQGDLYHPDFLLFSAAIGLGLTQQSLDSDEESDRTTGELDSYELSTQLLRSKPYPLSFYLNKSEDITTRQFLGPLESEHKSSGASLALRLENWPMNFQYGKSEMRQNALATALAATDFFSRDDERFQYSVRHDFSESSRMSFKFNRNEVSQKRLALSTDLNQDTYTLLHDLIFGSKKQHRLDSSFHYLDQSGSFSVQQLQWTERLRLEHTNNFLTNYSFRLTDTERLTSKNKTISI